MPSLLSGKSFAKCCNEEKQVATGDVEFLDEQFD
jgi:hypothetical protein